MEKNINSTQDEPRLCRCFACEKSYYTKEINPLFYCGYCATFTHHNFFSDTEDTKSKTEDKIHYYKIKDGKGMYLCNNEITTDSKIITNDFHKITCEDCQRQMIEDDLLKIPVEERTNVMHNILIKHYGGVRNYLLSMGKFKDVPIDDTDDTQDEPKGLKGSKPEFTNKKEFDFLKELRSYEGMFTCEECNLTTDKYYNTVEIVFRDYIKSLKLKKNVQDTQRVPCIECDKKIDNKFKWCSMKCKEKTFIENFENSQFTYRLM